jgi:putative integral membrane protein (TIGR02587 family)
MSHPRRAPTTTESLREYARGVGGGFLFSVPLLYTMEVWWAGFTVSPLRLLAGMAAVWVLLCAYNAYAGIRYDSGPAEIAIDSVEELGIGLVLAAVVLLLMGRIDLATAPSEIIGKVVVEGLFVAIGVSVGTAQLSSDDEEHSGSPHAERHTLLTEVALALCGAVLIGANVAPTEEIVVLGAEMTLWQLLGLMGASMVLALMLMFFSQFRGSARFAETRGVVALAQGTFVTYGSALAASVAMLAFFGRFAGQSLLMVTAQAVVLALPATLGAAAGRLLLKS